MIGIEERTLSASRLERSLLDVLRSQDVSD
jgi:hypothetical protein